MGLVSRPYTSVAGFELLSQPKLRPFCEDCDDNSQHGSYIKAATHRLLQFYYKPKLPCHISVSVFECQNTRLINFDGQTPALGNSSIDISLLSGAYTALDAFNETSLDELEKNKSSSGVEDLFNLKRSILQIYNNSLHTVALSDRSLFFFVCFPPSKWFMCD